MTATALFIVALAAGAACGDGGPGQEGPDAGVGGAVTSVAGQPGAEGRDVDGDTEGIDGYGEPSDE